MPEFESKYASMFSSPVEKGDAIVDTATTPYESKYASMFGEPVTQQPQQVGEDGEPIRLDAEGESYELPEGWEGLEDTWLGDFFTDLWREGRRGYRTARASESTAALIASPSEENIAEFVQDQEAIERVTQSAEMRDFQATVDQEGGGLYGIFKGILQNPTMPMQVIVSSMAGMFNAPALAAGATTWGGVSAAGAAGGPIGAAIAQVAAIPAGIGALSGVTDGLISYTEFMREELEKKGLAFNEDNVNAILNDKEAMATIRSRATARGVAVGVIDGLTAGIGKGLTGRLTKGLGVKKGALAISGIESVGGATGEAVAQQVSGQETNLSDIVLEGIAEVGGPGTAVNVYGAITEKDVTGTLDEEMDNEPGKYKFGDQELSRTEARAFYQNSPTIEIATTEVDIQGDPEMQAYAQDRKARAIADLQLAPDVTENRDRLVSLQIEIDKLQGKKGQDSKLRLKELKKRYNNLFEGKKEEDGIVDGEKGKKSVLKDTSLEPLEAPAEDRADLEVIEDEKTFLEELPDNIKNLRSEIAHLGDLNKASGPEYTKKLAELHRLEMIAKKQGIASPDPTPYYNLEREQERNPRLKRVKNLKKVSGDRTRAIQNFTAKSIKNLKKGEIDGLITGANPNTLRQIRNGLKGSNLIASVNPETGGEIIIHHKDENVKDLVTPAPGKFAINAPATMFTKEARQPGPRTNNKTLLIEEIRELLDNYKAELAAGKVATLYDIEQLSQESQDLLFSELEKRFGISNVKDIARKRHTGKTSRSFQFQGKTKRKRIGLSITENDETKLKANQSFLRRAVKRLNRAFPSVEIVWEYDAYFDALAEIQQEGVDIPIGTKGFAYKGKVYINPIEFTKDTPFHEVAHLTIDALAEDNPELFIKGWELLIGTEYQQAVSDIPYYQEMLAEDPIGFAKEVMANALGKGAVTLFESFEKQSAWERFKQLVTEWIKAKLKLDSPKSIDELTLDDWINIGAKGVVFGTATTKANETAQFARTAPEILWARQRTQYDNFTKKGTKPERGWYLEPKWAEIIEERAKSYPHKAIDQAKARKAEAVETGKVIQPEVERSKNPTFKKASGMFENFKKKYKKSYARNRQKYIADISNEDLSEATGRVFQDFNDADTTLADAFGRLGQRALPKKPDPEMSREEFRLVQYSVGAAMVRTLIQNGVLDVKYDVQLSSNIIEIVDTEFVNNMANAVAQLPPRNQDYRTVYTEKPPTQNQPVGQDGLNLNSRYHRESQMTRETHPKVYEVKDKADQVPYELDTEYVGFLTEFFNEGLLDDKSDTSGPKEKASKLRAIKTAIENLNTLGDQVFHEAHNFVHNGRVMSAATDVTHQGAKSTLAAFSFANKQPMGKKGWEWTQILAQDVYGYSGGDLLADRLKAAQQNTKMWMKWAADPKKYKNKIMEADTPMLFLRYILEMKKAIDSGNPETFESGLPNHMDATTSGIQFLAAMTKDQEAARIANLTNTKQRSDSYSEIVAGVLEENENLRETASAAQVKAMENAYNEFTAQEEVWQNKRKEANEKYPGKENSNERKAAHDAISAERKAWIAQFGNKKALASQYFWSRPGIRKKFRKIFKKPVMTKYYSSPVGGMAKGLMAQFKDNAAFAGLNLTHASWLASQINQAADRKLAGPGKVMRMLQTVAKEVFDAGGHVQYNNPVTGYTIVNDPKTSINERVYMAYDGPKSKYQGKDGGVGNIEVSVAADTDTKSLSKQKSQIAPLVVHSLDASLVQWLFLNTDFDLQTIHDSFAATPANTQALYDKIRQGFYEIMKGEPLLKILEQIYENAGFENAKALAKEKFDEVNVGTWDPKEIKDNEFGFSAGVTDPRVADKVLAATFEHKDAIALEGKLNSDTAVAKAEQTDIESKPCKI